MAGDMLDAARSLSNAALLWKIKITIKLTLAESDVSSLDAPAPLYLQAPRQSYLYTLVDQAKPMWQHLLTHGEHTPWFSHKALPLKWNTPIGVLYDLLVPGHGQEPWPLTLHFRGYPSETLPAFAGDSSLEATYINSLKEAAFIVSGTAGSVMKMVPAARQELWAAVSSCSYAKYNEILLSLDLGTKSRGSAPVRLFIRGVSGGYLSSYEGILRTSRPVAAASGDGKPVTLRAALMPLLTDWLDARSRTIGGASAGSKDGNKEKAATAAAAVAESAEEDGETEREEEDSCGNAAAGSKAAKKPKRKKKKRLAAVTVEEGGEKEEAGDVWEQSVRHVWVAGIAPPPDALLADLHRDLHCPDLFLYIVLHAVTPM